MLATVVLLLLCALAAIAGVPLILKLIPPNDAYGIHTERATSRAEYWYEVNWFAGWALVAAAGVTSLLLMLYNGTYLRSFWLQFLTLMVLLGIAVAASLWYEREVTLNGRRWSKGKKPRSRSRAPREVQPTRHP